MKHAKRLSGIEPASKLSTSLTTDISELSETLGAIKLVTIQLGTEAAASSYRRSISNTLSSFGLELQSIILPVDVTKDQLSSTITSLNNDPLIHGLIVLTPLPVHLSAFFIAGLVSPQKDVECVTSARRAALYSGDRTIAPATASAVDFLLNYYNVSLAGASVAIIGRSHTVGRPLALMLIDQDATVTTCHSKTVNLTEVTSKCDIVISAAGVPNLVSPTHVKSGATVIDIGTNYVQGKLTGDVDYEGLTEIASAISPVPGGVGPLTNLMLVKNLVTLLRRNT